MELLGIYMRLQTLEVLVHTLLFVYLETISVLHMSDLQFHLNPPSIKIGKWTRYCSESTHKSTYCFIGM